VIPVVKILFAGPSPYKFKKSPYKKVLYGDPHGEQLVPTFVPVLLCKKMFSTNQDENLLPLDDPGRVRSQIASIVRQIQRFDFDRNLVVTRKVII
jgi:hypothetical protein